MRQVIQRLLPPGSAWTLTGSLGLLTDGLADTMESVRIYVRATLAEALPVTATAMLREWHETLGQRYDATIPVHVQQRTLDALLTAIGGTSLNALNAQIHKELIEVDAHEILESGTSSIAGEAECGAEECNSDVSGTAINPFQYLISGTVENDHEASRVASVIAHYAPLHLVPQSSLIILSDTGTAECGIATCGIEECGYVP